MSNVPQRTSQQWLRTVRKVLRHVRWCTMGLILVIIGTIVYFANRDLPESTKRKVEAALRARGIDAQIGRLHWRFSRGIIAQDVRIGPALGETNSPRFSIREVELHLNREAVMHLHFNKIDSLALNGGKFLWELSDEPQSPQVLALTNIQFELRLQTNDQWELGQFSARFQDMTLHLTGSITNASGLRDWEIFHKKPGAPSGRLRENLREFVHAASLIKFAKPPELNVMIHGDGRDPQSFSGLITLETSGTTTPWGTLNNAQLIAHLTPPGAKYEIPHAEIKLRADEVDTRWGGAHSFKAELHAASDESLTNMIRARLEMWAGGVDTPWMVATNSHFLARWRHSPTNAVPSSGTVDIQLTGVRVQDAVADEAVLKGTLGPATNHPPVADESWGWWRHLEPCEIDWDCRFKQIHAGDFTSPELSCAGNWRAPLLDITNLHSEMYQGRLQGNAQLDVATRKARFACFSDFDVQKATPFLSPKAREWFRMQAMTWEKPPVGHVTGTVVVPEWTNRHPDWHAEVVPSLTLDGDFEIGPGSYRHVPFNSARSRYSYSNSVWTLPDLEAIRPEGQVNLALVSDDRNTNFYCRVKSGIDVKVFKSLFDKKAQKKFDWVQFTRPPSIEAEVWGQWRDPNSIGIRGSLAVTNFTVRGEKVAAFRGAVEYTNRFLLLKNGRVDRVEGYLTADALGADFKIMRGFLTNGFSTMDPMALMHVLGPKITSEIKPYHFGKPPKIGAYGVIPFTDDTSVADMHFQLSGGPFNWMKFNSVNVAGALDWVGDTLHLNLAQAECYGGSLTGTADFDFKRKNGTDFHFDMSATNASVAKLISDLTTETNHLEGLLSGRLVVSQANTEFTRESWFGNGWVKLTDGKIWEIPLFGVLTPVLDKISPDLGKSRIKDGSATFVITNSVIRSEDLELRSSIVRIRYKGTIDFEKNVNARAEVDVVNGTPVVGQVISMVSMPFSKFFEAEVTGTLKDPKSKPLHDVTKVVMPLIHPWDTIKDIWNFQFGPNTNAPVYPTTNGQ